MDKTLLKNTYFGYLEIKTPLQAARIQKLLDERYYNIDNKINNSKITIFNCLQNGYKPVIQEGEQHYKRDGELTQPKTIYTLEKQIEGKKGLVSTITLKKMEYDYCLYLLKNNYINETIANEYINKEIAAKQEKEFQEKQKLIKEQQEKELKEKQEQEYKNWMKIQIQNYNNINKFNLAKEIFFHEIGQYSDHQLKKLLILIENIDNDLCRENLIEWLHCGNTTSKKVFYYVTGIKLPSTDKETKPLLQKLTSSNYIGMIEYKPRKKPQGKELKTFYKSISIPKPHFEENLGEEVTKYSLTMFLTKSKCYCLTEAKSGCIIAQGLTREEVFTDLKKYIDHNGIDKLKNIIEHQINKTGLSPLYQDMNINKENVI